MNPKSRQSSTATVLASRDGSADVSEEGWPRIEIAGRLDSQSSGKIWYKALKGLGFKGPGAEKPGAGLFRP